MAKDIEAESPLILQNVDPSPVEDTPANVEKDSYFPASSPAPTPLRRSTTTLGLQDHSLTWWLNRVHRYSTYPFTAYLAAHITNTSILPLLTRSIPASDTYLLLTRPYYQSFPFEELLILAPVSLHVLSGLALRVLRRKRSLEYQGAESLSQRRAIPWPKVSGTSKLGYALVWLAGGHFALNRALPYIIAGGNSGIGLGYVAHGFARAPIVSWVGFSALIGVGVSHVVWGWAKWLGLLPETAAMRTVGTSEEKRLVTRRRRWIINGTSLLMSGLWAAGALGVVARAGKAVGWEGRNYDRLLQSVPVIGNWL